jgi:hypothetical protein
VGLALLEYQVFSNQKVSPASASIQTVEIDLNKSVPSGETWRVDRISAVVLVPNGIGNVFVTAQPILFVYDTINPAPTTLPIDVTALQTYATAGQSNPPPIASPSTIYFLDADDLAAPITLLSGFQLACVFYAPWINTIWQAAVRIQYTRFAGTGGDPQPLAA